MIMTTIQHPADVNVDIAARRLYEAEVALHAAHTSRVDEWISAASSRLHDALEAHLAAVAAARH
jgi:hypothetical protein